MKAFIVPGMPGWFYALLPLDMSPGAVNWVRHVIPGQRPLAILAEAEGKV